MNNAKVLHVKGICFTQLEH